MLICPILEFLRHIVIVYVYSKEKAQYKPTRHLKMTL